MFRKYTYKAFNGGINIIKCGRVIRFVPCDADLKALKLLARKCNKLKLDPIHIDDVIEDLIYEVSIPDK